MVQRGSEAGAHGVATATVLSLGSLPLSRDPRRFLQTIQSPGHCVECRPRRTLAQQAQEFLSESSPVRKLVATGPTPRCDHRTHHVLADRLPSPQPSVRAGTGQLPGLSRSGSRTLLLQTAPQTDHVGHGLSCGAPAQPRSRRPATRPREGASGLAGRRIGRRIGSGTGPPVGEQTSSGCRRKRCPCRGTACPTGVACENSGGLPGGAAPLGACPDPTVQATVGATLQPPAGATGAVGRGVPYGSRRRPGAPVGDPLSSCSDPLSAAAPTWAWGKSYGNS
jgi:hypothetical protein